MKQTLSSVSVDLAKDENEDQPIEDDGCMIPIARQDIPDMFPLAQYCLERLVMVTYHKFTSY
jgi:hypothetical protein